MTHRTSDELERGLPHVRNSPGDRGTLEMIVRRPGVGERIVCESVQLDPDVGVVGDNWSVRGSSRTPDGSAHPDMQVTLMNSRLVDLVAGSRERWPEAGDQLYVDFDLSEANLAPGTELEIGTARLVITPQPHTGCRKFVDRFGLDAMKLLSSPAGRELRLRGIYARVVRGGTVTMGDAVLKVRTTT